MKNIIKNEFQGWKVWETLWLLGTSVIMIGLSIYWKDSLMGIISATTGMAYVVCTGKGKLCAYFFGLINSVLYAIISYHAKLYGETMLNLFYYVPMLVVGFFSWLKHMNEETKEVSKRSMKALGRGIMIASIALGTLGYGFVLKWMGDSMPFVDSFTTVASVVAMILTVKMYAEQWWIWFFVDLVTIYMWWTSFKVGQDNMATLVMWIMYLLTAILMGVKWEKEAKKL